MVSKKSCSRCKREFEATTEYFRPRKHRNGSGLQSHCRDCHALYDIFYHMGRRCNNPKSPKYRLYGGRGIECRFSSLGELLKEMGPRLSREHSVDRIDCNGHYEPGNVRWATRKTQARNRRDNKLSADGVRRIKKLYGMGRTQDEIALVAGVGQSHVSQIIRGMRWADVSI